MILRLAGTTLGVLAVIAASAQAGAKPPPRPAPSRPAPRPAPAVSRPAPRPSPSASRPAPRPSNPMTIPRIASAPRPTSNSRPTTPAPVRSAASNPGRAVAAPRTIVPQTRSAQPTPAARTTGVSKSPANRLAQPAAANRSSGLTITPARTSSGLPKNTLPARAPANGLTVSKPGSAKPVAPANRSPATATANRATSPGARTAPRNTLPSSASTVAVPTKDGGYTIPAPIGSNLASVTYTKDNGGPYYVSYQRKGDTSPDGGELSGVYSTRAQADKAVQDIQKWAATIEPGYWQIKNIKVESSGTPATKPAATTTAAKPSPAPSNQISSSTLKTSLPGISKPRAEAWTKPLNDAMAKFGIDTPERKAAFLAQLSVESGKLRYTRELADGWAYDKSVNPKKAQALGNTEEGDGPRYKGRGPIQLTGRANYLAAGKALGLGDQLEQNPEMVEDPEIGAQVAAWFWQKNGLNQLADQAQTDQDFDKISGVINRGNPNKKALHQQERRDAWEKAKEGLGIGGSSNTPMN